MKLLLVAGGILQDTPALRCKIKTDYALTIAVDRGYDHCMALGLTPDVLLGDLDSVRGQAYCCKVIQFPPEKDDTDLRLAVDYALAQGASSIDILCATGGRLDQFLGNLSLLEYLHSAYPALPARILDEDNVIAVISQNTPPQMRKNTSKYISVMPLSDEIIFSGTGLKYPADHVTVSRRNIISVSNECTCDCFSVTIHSGIAYLIQAD